MLERARKLLDAVRTAREEANALEVKPVQVGAAVLGFVFNGRYALSGAQEPEAFFHMFDLAREDDKVRSEAALA